MIQSNIIRRELLQSYPTCQAFVARLEKLVLQIVVAAVVVGSEMMMVMMVVIFFRFIGALFPFCLVVDVVAVVFGVAPGEL